MTWEEGTGSFEFNIFGLFSLAASLTLAFLYGTLLHVFPELNIPEININDIITITLSALSGIFVIVKIANGVLSFVSKYADWKEEKEEKALKIKMRDRINQSKDEPTNTRREEEGLKMGDPAS